MVERRKHKRFRVKANAFVMLKPCPPGTGACRLIDISVGGLSFDCFISQELPIEATEVDIFLTDSHFHVPNVPCRSIWNLTMYEGPSASRYRRRCGVEFGALTPQQKTQLEYFIHNYTIREASPMPNFH